MEAEEAVQDVGVLALGRVGRGFIEGKGRGGGAVIVGELLQNEMKGTKGGFQRNVKEEARRSGRHADQGWIDRHARQGHSPGRS